MNESNTLSIIRYNVRKSRECKAKNGWTDECREILAQPKRLDADTIHTKLRRYGKTTEQLATTREELSESPKEEPPRAGRKSDSDPRVSLAVSQMDPKPSQQAPNTTPALKDPDNSQIKVAPKEKAVLSRRTFFPEARQADLSDTEGATHAEPIDLPPITPQEFQEAIVQVAPNRSTTASRTEHLTTSHQAL